MLKTFRNRNIPQTVKGLQILLKYCNEEEIKEAVSEARRTGLCIDREIDGKVIRFFIDHNKDIIYLFPNGEF